MRGDEVGVGKPRQPQRPAGEHRAFFLVGPTATGKTAVAQRLAEQNDWNILSADSMLVYRGMDTGTAKPTAAERSRVGYRGLDLADPADTFNVAFYLEHAREAFREAAAAGREVMVVGGTGLYVKCLTEGLAAGPGADPEIRARAERCLAERGVEALRELVRAEAPEAYGRLRDNRNPRRLVRALEQGADASRQGVWKGPPGVPMAGLRMDSALLYERIAARVEAMYAAGLLEEARRLMKDSGKLSRTALQAIGYAEAMAVAEGKARLKDAVQITITRTRRLARRQMTWFRHQGRVEWIDVSRDMDTGEVARRVMAVWEKHGPTPVNV